MLFSGLQVSRYELYVREHDLGQTHRSLHPPAQRCCLYHAVKAHEAHHDETLIGAHSVMCRIDMNHKHCLLPEGEQMQQQDAM